MNRRQLSTLRGITSGSDLYEPPAAQRSISISWQFRRVATMLWLVTAVAMPFRTSQAQADDSIPVVTISCPGCNSFNALSSRAHYYFDQWKNQTPPGHPAGKYVRPVAAYSTDWSGELVVDGLYGGTIALVVSDAYPLSATIEFSETRDGIVQSTPIGVFDNLSARDFDNRVFARSTKLDPIELPPGVTPSDGNEGISPKINETLVRVPGGVKRDWWHALWNFPELVALKFIVNQPGHPSDGQQVWIFIGDTITVRYPDGSTEKWKLTDAFGSLTWTRVDGTLRDKDGNEPNQQSSWTPGAGEQGQLSFLWTGANNYQTQWYTFPIVFNPVDLPRGHVTIRQLSIGTGRTHDFALHISN